MKAKVLFCALFVAVLSGCSTTVQLVDSQARALEPEHSMHLMPLLADLSVSSVRITHVETKAFEAINIVDISSLTKKVLDKYKQIALSRAADRYSADVIVGAIVDVQVVKGKIEAVVHGYPANYKNFRNLTLDDAAVLKAAQISVDSIEIKEEQKISTLFNLRQTR